MGPIAINWLDSRKWGSAIIGQVPDITLGLTRVVIGIQLVMAGYQLPAQYVRYRWKEMILILIVVMTLMWLCTAACMMALVPNITFLSGLAIASLVTSTDPVLSQAVAKGPFADKFVRRNLREIISAEAGANDGFGFPFLMLATYLIRHAESPDVDAEVAAFEESGGVAERLVRSVTTLVARAGDSENSDLGRLGGGVGEALKNWTLETWLYFVLMSIVYGAVVGFIMLWATRIATRRKWIDVESYLLVPTAIGLFAIGTCGMIGTDDLLACFCAGSVLNWDGEFLRECERKHDEVNGTIDVILNLGGFAYIGMVIPWRDFHDPDGTGLTIPRLIGLGIMVILFRRLPAIFATYRLMPSCVTDWKEALFMGYFGPIGIGAVFYVEHARHLFPEFENAQTQEERQLISVMVPVVYWLVLFSIVWHGLSIPALNAFYSWKGVEPVTDDDGPVMVKALSENNPLPNNATSRRGSIYLNNRFSRSYNTAETDMRAVEDYRRRTQRWESVQLKLDPEDADRERDAVVAMFTEPRDRERKTTFASLEGRRRSVSRGPETGEKFRDPFPRTPTGVSFGKEKATTLQWSDPSYGNALRRSKLGSKAWGRDEEEGKPSAGLAAQESPRPKTGWM